MDVLDFARSLPAGKLPALQDSDAGLSVTASMPKSFVAPSIVLRDASNAPVATLITAPAAAGKSTCASAIAAISGAAYLDLAGRIVGDGSFTGLLDLGFGEEASLAFRQKLKSGEVSLVIDALDEAQVASRETAFISFLKSMCWYLRTSAGSGNVVLLGRLDTAEYVLETFAEQGVPIAHYELDYFDQSQSNEFLDKKLDALYLDGDSHPQHRRHRELYTQARDQLFNQLAGALGQASSSEAWGTAEGRRLIGYSPVLEGAAAYLNVDDFRTIISDTPSSLSGLGEWQVLTDLFTNLMHREQAKFLGSWPDDLEKGYFSRSEDVANIFSPLEQSERLLQRVLRLPYETSSALVPPAISGSYEDAVASQLPNHPFLSGNAFVNTLFRDYALALVLSTTQNEKVSKAILAYLRSANRLPSPALGPFFVTLARDSGVPVAVLDVVLSSISAREDVATQYGYLVDLTGERGVLLIETVSSTESDDLQQVSVALIANQSSVPLPSRCKDLRLDTDHDVTFASESVRIGPNVRITAETITFEGSAVHVNARSEVRLEADIILAGWEQTAEVEGDDFEAYCAESEGWVYRWAKPLSDSVPPSQNEQMLYVVNRMLSFFKKTQHVSAGDLAANKEDIERFVIKNDPRARALMQKMRSDHYLSEVGPSLVLSRTFFIDTNSSATEVRNRKSSAGLDTYFNSI